jgi:hypothetical protein
VTRYLLSIYQPDEPPPPEVRAKMDAVMAEVGALLQEAKDAGAWVFNGGLHPPSTATVVRHRDGEALITDGPYVEGKEHAALVWARRLARVLAPLPIEVRPFHSAAEG